MPWNELLDQVFPSGPPPAQEVFGGYEDAAVARLPAAGAAAQTIELLVFSLHVYDPLSQRDPRE